MPGPCKQFDRTEVLEKAMELFWTHGFKATGMCQLVDEMGIGRQSLYDTFGDKRSLFLEALEHFAQTRFQKAVRRLLEPGDPLGRIRGVLEGWKANLSDPACRGCLISNSLAEFGELDPQVNRLLQRHLLLLEEAFHSRLQEALENGELAPGTNIRDLARLLVNTGQGLALVAKLHYSPDFLTSVINASLDLLPASTTPA